MVIRKYDGHLCGQLGKLQHTIVSCRDCQRLVEFRKSLSFNPRVAQCVDDQWNAPVPSHGDPLGRLLLVGLAPGLEGANRTGRMFTGDSSASFLSSALYRFGFATKPISEHKDDGFQLIDAFETCIVRCVPPDNKPSAIEQRQCRPFLMREFDLLPNIGVVLALGHLAFNNTLAVLRERAFRGDEVAHRFSLKFKFKHGAMYEIGHGIPILYASYHPSPRNTRTGRLTIELFDNVLNDIRRYLDAFSKL